MILYALHKMAMETVVAGQDLDKGTLQKLAKVTASMIKQVENCY